jgi:hypothetical protein
VSEHPVLPSLHLPSLLAGQHVSTPASQACQHFSFWIRKLWLKC